MRGRPGEPVQVWLRDGRPARFGWRARMYTVMYVLDRTGTAESECWQVEATPVLAVPPAIYLLCHDLGADRWTVQPG